MIMENTIAKRIKQLRAHYNLGVKEFAERCSLSHVAIFHLESGKTVKPHKSSLQRIANVFGTTAEWILFGKNEMLPNGTRELQTEVTGDVFWKEEAYLEIKSRNAMLEKEVERLWQMISHFTSGSKPNFRMLDAV
jgi:transcriptional regulator with XRE-family HTH domain